MKPFYFIVIFIYCFTLSAQTISGVVYNNTSTLQDIKIENINNNVSVFTNKNGEFNIKATIKDTLLISAMFYKTQEVVVKPSYLTETFVIQLEEQKNVLQEVNIYGTEKEKLADIEKTQSSLRNQILEDIKNNPHLYGRMPEGNLDFIKIIGLVAKLFKNKNKAEPFKPIAYQDLNTLFNKKHTLFNDTLLIETLNIEKDKKFLFFEFLEAKNINSKLLSNDKEIELLETIINASEEFNSIIKNFKKHKTN
ncbi:peptidase associated/transthyretin-like domain-containing protein [Lacinutrix venerupis]|uniref:Carboxypeptidase-like protein n=1 Tax=Lacinutrix venerupis TaxID=1486034 RepID=A0AAC9LME4_9FLAO|nr:hypothetical protein [Lacinutrix venerupis]APY00035.1 hypothetical protein BWR22_06835 [Lacinutrix venerupis]